MKSITIMVLSLCALFSACTPEAKQYECSKYSAECELQKDQVLLVPIDYDSTLIDAFGYEIVTREEDRQQWYLVSTKARVLVPVVVPVEDGTGSVNAGPHYEYYPSLEMLVNRKLARINGKIDTVIDPTLVNGMRSFVIVVLGPNEIVNRGLTAQVAYAK